METTWNIQGKCKSCGKTETFEKGSLMGSDWLIGGKWAGKFQDKLLCNDCAEIESKPGWVGKVRFMQPKEREKRLGQRMVKKDLTKKELADSITAILARIEDAIDNHQEGVEDIRMVRSIMRKLRDIREPLRRHLPY